MSQSELEKWLKKNQRKNSISFWLRFLPVLIIGYFIVGAIHDAMKEGIESLPPQILLILCLGFGMLMIWLAIDQGFLQRNRCTTAVKAECIGINYVRKSGYCPRFYFEWEGKPHYGEPARYASKHKTKQRYIEGEQYEILINPDNPREIRVDQKIGWNNIFLLVMGIVMVVLPMYILLLELEVK